MRQCIKCKKELSEEYFDYRESKWCKDCCGFRNHGSSYITVDEKKRIAANAPVLEKLQELNTVRLWILNRLQPRWSVVKSLVDCGMTRSEAYKHDELIKIIQLQRKTSQLIKDKEKLDRLQNEILYYKTLLQ